MQGGLIRLIIGLTGGIASGKTITGDILAELGAYIIDADEIAHSILKKGQEGWKGIVECFGSKVLADSGEIDRSVLGEIVFNNEKKRHILESVTHPIIIQKIKKEIDEAKKEERVIVLIVPLLYETNMDKLVDQVLVIYVDRETQFARLQKRKGISRSEARKRIDAQLSLEKKKKMADLVIDNRGTKKELKDKVINLWEKLL